METKPVGRPPIFKTVEEMSEKIEEYFDWCDNRMKSYYNEKAGTDVQVNDPAPYTMSGLARRLGMDRDTLINYAHKDEFVGTIKAARERVHEDVETRLMEKQATGAIFNLKNNFGWKDKSENDITTGGEKIESLVVYKPEKK